MIEQFQQFAKTFSELAWGPWLLVLLLGGGAFFLVYSRLTPFRHLPHAIALLRGRFDEADDPGQISHFQALSSALAGTIGMGNIAGVALALTIGGPGAIFSVWMTKFFTCTLAVMYRGRDSEGRLQGGPMYVVREGLGPRWRWLAVWFAVFGLIGTLPALQANQLVQILRDVALIDTGLVGARDDHLLVNLFLGVGITLVAGAVIFGGLTRIARVASALVPTMAGLYLAATVLALLVNADSLPGVFAMIFREAFAVDAAGGGALLATILYGVQRGAFSNEAGIGTEALAHGAARTHEPVREGLVAMLGPIIDTLLICTATALVILSSGIWQQDASGDGVTLTANAFASILGTPGLILVFFCVVAFALTTMFTYSFYGSQCASFLFGAASQRYYRMVYVGFIVVASVISFGAAISIIDGAYALMAIPTMVSALLLAPKVRAAQRRYFDGLDRQAAGLPRSSGPD